MNHRIVKKLTYRNFFFSLLALVADGATAQNRAIIDVNLNAEHQVIDGFGAHQSDNSINEDWWLQLYYQDMECSIYRVDLTPVLKSPYSDLSYYSPWFMGSQVKSVFNLEDPANPNGPENNRVRTYTGPNDYSRLFGGMRAPIAVMGPDIEKNIGYFQYTKNEAIAAGIRERSRLGDFKLVGSLWSPVPWVKVSSGNRYDQDWWPGPVKNSPWPFIWGGNFAGGRLDVSNTPLQVFNDASLGGTGPTSSLTQFARSTAAYIMGFQRFHNAKFYAISIQNELNFEQFYSSATYPLSSQYIAALKAIRQEFDKYPELRDIRLMGPEDLLGGDAYGMWEYGGPIHKNLQYIKNVESDSAASRALSFYCVHGYAADGVTAGSANPRLWDWWVNGWTSSPAPGLPAQVKGTASFRKKSWMTETSGENRAWLFPPNGFPGDGGLGVGIRIHQALTSGNQSAWIYWTFADSDAQGQVSNFGLTNRNAANQSPKYVAAKHFFKPIRPNSVRVGTSVSGSNTLLASAYLHKGDRDLCIVLINTSAQSQGAEIKIPVGDMHFASFTSQLNQYWVNASAELKQGVVNLQVPAYGMVSLKGKLPTVKNTDIADDDILILPDYSNKQIHLTIPGDTPSELQVSLYSIDGRQYNRLSLLPNQSTHTVTCADMPVGVYILSVMQQGRLKAKPFYWQP